VVVSVGQKWASSWGCLAKMILLAVLTYNVVGTRAKGKVFRVAGSAIAVGKQ